MNSCDSFWIGVSTFGLVYWLGWPATVVIWAVVVWLLWVPGPTREERLEEARKMIAEHALIAQQRIADNTETAKTGSPNAGIDSGPARVSQ